jgi:hypothetical protein
MKTSLPTSSALLAGAAFLLTLSIADARPPYGVSRPPMPPSRPPESAPRPPSNPGAAPAPGRYGAPTGAPGARPPVPIVGAPGAPGARPPVPGAPPPRYPGYYPPATGVVVAPVVTTPAIPPGYVATIPPGYQVVNYQGITCYYVGGVYYRPVFYAGSTIYLVMR